MKNIWKMIGIVALLFLAVIGFGNALGFMITKGASFVAIIGEIIAIIPAVLLGIRIFKEDVAPPKQ